MKCAPDYCNIYVVAKGKSVNVRLAKCGVPPMHSGADTGSDTDSQSGMYVRRGSRGHLPPVMPDAASRRSVDGRNLPELTTRPPFRERSLPSSATKNVVVAPPGKDYSDTSNRSARQDSFGGDLDFGPSMRFSSIDFGENLDLSTTLTASPAREPMSPATGVSDSIMPSFVRSWSDFLLLSTVVRCC